MRNKLVAGVGVNDSEYQVTRYEIINGKRVMVWVCPFYACWKYMLVRCYSMKCHKKQPTYQCATVAEIWHKFSNFKRWMERQDWIGNCLDKDILFVGNKIYSEATCRFISPLINSFITDNAARRGEWPIGVNLDKRTGKFRAECRNPFKLKNEYIGSFSSPESAHEAWRKRKLSHAKALSKTIKDKDLSEALVGRYL